MLSIAPCKRSGLCVTRRIINRRRSLLQSRLFVRPPDCIHPPSSFKPSQKTPRTISPSLLHRPQRLQKRWLSILDEDKKSLDDNTNDLVYESPMGNVVTRLRTVTLVTGIVGSLGLPMVVALKGGDLPSTGLLAVGMTFVAGTLGSTAAIYFVFSPYVYSIERIPVRQCHYQPSSCESDTSVNITESNCADGELDKNSDDFLLKAVTRSLFLTQIDTVFDPTKDVIPYKGLRPLCNFSVKGIPMYVHTDFVYNKGMRKALDLDKDKKQLPIQENPDDFL